MQTNLKVKILVNTINNEMEKMDRKKFEKEEVKSIKGAIKRKLKGQHKSMSDFTACLV